MSIFPICITASKARSAAARSGSAIAAVRARGVICHDSDAVDGWFAGYAGNVVAVSWMGHDQPKSLGGREFGATLALSIWIDYMRQALSGKPLSERKPPPGVSFVDGDWLYDEFKGDEGVKTLDVEVSPLKSIFDAIRKAFGG